MSIVCKTINTTGKHLYGVTVEAFLRKRLPYFSLIGLPDASLSDTRERIKVGMQASGITWPDCRITVNLTPASMGKADGICDLAIALVVRGLAEYNNNPDYDLHVYLAGLRGLVAIGKINADGDVHSTPISAKDVVAYAVKHGVKRVLVPYSSFLDYLSVEDSEATEIDSCIIKGVEILGIKNLTEAFSVVDGFGNAGNSDIGGLNAKRMEAALHEVWKWYDEAGESGESYMLDPDNLAKFAANLCKDTKNTDTLEATGLSCGLLGISEPSTRGMMFRHARIYFQEELSCPSKPPSSTCPAENGVWKPVKAHGR